MHSPFINIKSVSSIATILCTLLTLSACQSVQDQRIPLSASFSQNAEVITVRKPIAQYKDQHFEQATSNFLVRGMNIARGHSERSEQFFSQSGLSGIQLQSADRFTRFLWNEILGMRPMLRQQYKLAREREFHFQVAQNLDSNVSPRPIDVQCQLYQLDDVAQVEREGRDRKGNDLKSVSTDSRRLYSFLRCELNQNEKFWHLSLDMNQNQAPQIQLGLPISESAHDFFVIEHEQKNQYLVGGQWRDSNIPFAALSGLHVYKNDTQVAALSFEGQTPKVWLNKSNDQETKKLLFAASYAILMYDWLDQEWRKQ